eukprot:TRINITY_DN1393_c0_g1_i2.p1 TRINITY_DN1393_c0_g1~~TRINITY_DN1393_c0_g1_i2.p1  ORF type:complete len:124 (-),score=19.90 TRINITY_DN1393_c0_g1_i2:112-483(-)
MSSSVTAGGDGKGDLRSLVLFGTDWMKIACIRNTGIYGLMGAIGTSVGYHLFTSRSPFHVFTATFIGITIPYWINCRLNHREKLSEVRQVKAVMSGNVGTGKGRGGDEPSEWVPSTENIKKDS